MWLGAPAPRVSHLSRLLRVHPEISLSILLPRGGAAGLPQRRCPHFCSKASVSSNSPFRKPFSWSQELSEMVPNDCLYQIATLPPGFSLSLPTPSKALFSLLAGPCQSQAGLGGGTMLSGPSSPAHSFLLSFSSLARLP